MKELIRRIVCTFQQALRLAGRPDKVSAGRVVEADALADVDVGDAADASNIVAPHVPVPVEAESAWKQA